MTSVFLYFANFTTAYSILLGVLGLLIYFKSSHSARVFCTYLFVAGSIELVSFSFADSGINNLVFFHLFTFMELGLIGVFFSLIFRRLKVSFDIMYLVYPFLVLVILNSVFVQSIDSFSTYSSTVVSIAIIIGCIFIFSRLLERDLGRDSKAVRWILSGLFIYHMGSIVVSLNADLLMNVDSDVQIIIWIIRTFIILLSKVLFTIGLLQEAKHRSKVLSYG